MMHEILFTGITVDDLLLRIEQIIDKKLEGKSQHKVEQLAKYLTRKEVAGLLNVTLPTLHNWTKKGWLKSYPIGRRVNYKPEDIKEAVEKVGTLKHKKGGLL